MPNRPTTERRTAVLVYSESEHHADQWYLTRFRAGDPFIALAWRGRTYGVFTALELGRAHRESKLKHILSLEDLQARARAHLKVDSAGPAEVITTLAHELKVSRFRVPSDFPLGLARRLEALHLSIEPAEGPLFPEREVKGPAEIRAIAEGNRCAAIGLATAETLLRESRIVRGRLIHDGRALTSERVREAIEIACLRAGARALHTIVAGGDQACDPHCRGQGPLRARELIIVDVFPRVMESGFFGDMTRTFLRGEPSTDQARLVETVRKAQQLAIRTVRAGIDGGVVHQAVVDHFEKSHYATKRSESGASGFFHGTGHGLGLEVHESPSLSRRPSRLRSGAVVTVEPGLYYPGLGGCRIEDVVQVTSAAPKLLTHYTYQWVLP